MILINSLKLLKLIYMTDLISLRLGHDLRQSPEYGRYMEKLGWDAVVVDGVSVFIRKIGPIRFAKIRRAPPQTYWSTFQKSLRPLKPVITQVDPESGIPPKPYHRTRDQILGTKTLLIDLRLPKEQIISSFKPETRLKLHKLSREKHMVTLNDFSGFYHILKAGLAGISVWCPPYKEYENFYQAFSKHCFCLTIDGLAGCLVIIHDQIAEYYYAGSLREGKAHNLPYLVVWEAMLEAKQRGAKVWDFNGLIDPRWPEKRWAGFSFFKTRFGGTELSFSGTYVKYGWW